MPEVLKFLKCWKMGVFWVIKCVLSVNVRLSKLIIEVGLWTGYLCWVKVGHNKWEVDQCCLHVGGDAVCGGDVFVTYFRCWSEDVCEFLWWKNLFVMTWGQYVVEMYLWPILGVEVRCMNFCDEKIYLSWPRANRSWGWRNGSPSLG